ncbi:MAG: L,D-transpeptidase [candidate division WOR-3 bacterium]
MRLTLKTREQVLLSIFFLIIAFFLVFFAEMLLPFSETINFDVISQSVRIYRARQKQKEIFAAYAKLKQKVKFKEDEFALTLAKTETPIESNFYAVVNLLSNTLFLKKQDLVINEFKISAGRGDTLIAPWGKKWVFETPTGVLRVLRKIKNPIWYKPDWAFLEAKESIPPPNSPKRLVRGILGDYALDLGGGIMLHGTPYEHLLGQRVSHGCIRLPKEGIKTLYDSMPLGGKVYIFGK